MNDKNPISHIDLFERPIFATIATIMPDGSPHLTPIWIDLEDDLLLFTVIAGHVKHRNMEKNPQVAITLFDPDYPYRYIMIRGNVIEITERGAYEHSKKMAIKYLGPDGEYVFKDGETPRLFKVAPTKISIQ